MNFDFFTVERVTVVSVGCFIIIIVKKIIVTVKKKDKGMKIQKEGKEEKTRNQGSLRLVIISETV